jgi:predicted nicotinamide N-methyase
MDVTLPDTADTKRVPLISRTISIHDRLNITVWERKDPSEIMGAYWEAQSTNLEGIRQSQQKLLDPFGLVSWPGSVKAAQELCRRAETAVKDRHVVVVGAGVGVEAQTAAILGAKKVLATDIHPTTLQQLEFGVQQESRIHNKDIVQTQILDLFESSDNQPIPVPCDLLVVADVLYNEQLAAQVCRRCAESVQQNPAVRILITDSQRFVPEFIDNLNKELSNVVPRDTFKPMQWKMEMMKGFTGSGVMIDEDQTYDVKVHYLWIGLK